MKTEKYFIACNKQDGTVTFGKAYANFEEFDTFYTKLLGRIHYCYKDHSEYFFIDKVADACWLMGELNERGILKFNNCEWIVNFVEIAERKNGSRWITFWIRDKRKN